MIDVNILLNVLLSIFGIILLIVLIILGIKTILLIDKASKVLDKVDRKVDSLDNLFMLIDRTTTGISTITDKISFSVLNLISRVFSKNKKIKKNEEEKYE